MPINVVGCYILTIMLKIFTAFLSFLMLNTVSGQIETEMIFKFTNQNVTVYKAIMQPENIDSVKFSSPLFNTFDKDSSIKNDNFPDSFFMRALKQQLNRDNYFVIKKIKDNKFLLAYTNTDTSNDLLTMNSKYNAYIDNKGNNLSFYLANDVNDIAKLFFGLPDNKIKVGSTWKLGIDLIDFKGFVKCDSSFKKDTVTVTDISVKDDDTLITVNYDFQEYFKGTFWVPTSSNLKYYGKAIFSVKQGLWLKYDCVKEGEMTGFFNSKGKEIYRLELTTSYPKTILKQIEE